MHPAYEFFRSFGSNGGQFPGWPGDGTPQEQETLALRTAKLTGHFPSPLPSQGACNDGQEIDWELARVWEEELRKRNVKRPSTIQGIDKIADVNEVLCCLLPWRLTNQDFLRMNDEVDQINALKRMSEKQLVGLLNHLGF